MPIYHNVLYNKKIEIAKVSHEQSNLIYSFLETMSIGMFSYVKPIAKVTKLIVFTFIEKN